jgi:hypothetical protein
MLSPAQRAVVGPGAAAIGPAHGALQPVRRV